MLDFFQKYLCFGSAKHRSASTRLPEKRRPVERSERLRCEKCGKETIPSLYETHKTMYCPGAPIAKPTNEPTIRKDPKPKVSSHDVSMEVSKREEPKGRKPNQDRSPMSRSQVYRQDGDKSMMSQSVASMKTGNSRSQVEKKRSALDPMQKTHSEMKEMSKSVKLEGISKVDEISILVNQLQGKSIDERHPLELKFIQDNLNKKSILEYIVAGEWIKKYQDYLNEQTKVLPGKIINNKENRKSEEICTVNETVWRFIVQLYGGGPEVSRPNRSISISQSESDKSEPMTADTMSRSEATESAKNSTGSLAKSFAKKTNFYLKPMGMVNRSFYCYMNSCLQGLLSIGELAQYASEEKYKSVANGKNQKFWRGMTEIVASHSRRAVSAAVPKEIRRLSMNTFDPDEQHDAHEFLRFLISAMQDEINLPRPKKQVEITDPDSSWVYYRRYNVSIVDELFAGQLVNNVLCTSCKHVSTTFDPFLDLSLPIMPGKTNNIDDCLEVFQKEEEIKDSYVCEKCKSKSRAIKRLVVNKFPRYLVIHLKRFQTYPRKRKITDHINFPLDNWNIKKINGKEVHTYALTGSIVHQGSFDSGHYFCYAKRNGEWFLCNDEAVRSVTSKEVLSKEAYVLIYERKN